MTGHQHGAPRFDPAERAMICAAVETWLGAQRAGMPAADNLNLAQYAAEILPKMCDRIAELEAMASYHQHQHDRAYRELVRLRERAR